MMHHVSVAWLTDALNKGIYDTSDCHTPRMAADVLTKAFMSKASWENAISLVCIVFDEKVLEKLQKGAK